MLKWSTKTFSKFCMMEKLEHNVTLVGLQDVIRGMDACVDKEEIKSVLRKMGAKAKSVANLRKRDGVPQPLYYMKYKYNKMQITKIKKPKART